MKSFKERMGFFKKGMKVKTDETLGKYFCKDILIREEIETGECSIYQKSGKKLNEDTWECIVEAKNMEDESDRIQYKVQRLPGGRTKTCNPRSHLYTLYPFSTLHYAMFGESLLGSQLLDKEKIEQVVEEYKVHKQEAKYHTLFRTVRNGKIAYIGESDEGKVVVQSLENKEFEGEGTRKIESNSSLEGLGESRQKARCLNFTEKAMQRISKQDQASREEKKRGNGISL